MKNKLAEGIAKKTNKRAYTENGAISNKSSLDAVLDLFSKMGSARTMDNSTLLKLVDKSIADSFESTLKVIFWARDVRGGAGERNVPRKALKHIIDNYKLTIGVDVIINKIVEFGRWDDLYIFENTKYWDNVVTRIKNQLALDLESDSPSLMAKWLKSTNASSKESRRLGRLTAKSLGYSEASYRKVLSKLRERINIVETHISEKDYESIDYSKIPAKAGFKYRKAFARNDNERYTQFIQDVSDGKTKVNASVNFPSDIVKQAWRVSSPDTKALDMYWENLPNYVENPSNTLVVADVSGSMRGDPIIASISLAIYMAERNKGIWHNQFITFSKRPSLNSVTGANIVSKVQNLEKSEWGYNTDLQSVFELILKTAEKNNLSQEDMPETVIIVSDMQFDQACKNNNKTNFEVVKKKYKKAGYSLPKLVFWNVNAREEQPVTKDDINTCLVSGYSPAILKFILTNEDFSPLSVLNDTVLNNPRYNL